MNRYLIQITGIFLCAAALLLSLPPARAQSDRAIDEIRGQWATQGYGAVVAFHECSEVPETLCGTLKWLWSGEEAAVAIGELMFWGGIATGSIWKNGRLLNPENGREYRGQIQQLGPDLLLLKGCTLTVLCQEQRWRRLESLPHVVWPESSAVASK